MSVKTLSYQSRFSDEPDELILHVGNYYSDPMVMSIQADMEDGEPYAVATVNLGNSIGNGSFMQQGCSFLDENNMSGIGTALEEAGLAEPYMRFGEPVMGYSGYCEYPLYQFNLDKLAEYDPEGVEVYKQIWASALEVEQKAMEADFDLQSSNLEFDDIEF